MGSHHFDRRATSLIATGQGGADDMLTSKQVSDWLGVSPLWLVNGRSKGFGPKYVRIGPRSILYRRKDVLAFLDERTFACTSEYDNHSFRAKPAKRKSR